MESCGRDLVWYTIPVLGNKNCENPRKRRLCDPLDGEVPFLTFRAFLLSFHLFSLRSAYSFLLFVSFFILALVTGRLQKYFVWRRLLNFVNSFNTLVFGHVKMRIAVSHLVFWNSTRRKHLRSRCSFTCQRIAARAVRTSLRYGVATCSTCQGEKQICTFTGSSTLKIIQNN